MKNETDTKEETAENEAKKNVTDSPEILQLSAEIGANEAGIKSLKAVNPPEIYEELSVFMCLHDPNLYRGKLSGFQRQPFSVREKDTQRLPKEMVEHYRVQPKEITEKIKEEIKRLREEKARTKMQEKGFTTPSGQNSVIPSSRHGKGKGASNYSDIKGGSGPSNRRKKHGSEDIGHKITLLSLGNISYKELGMIKGEEFDPAQLLTNEEEDNEYKEILKKFECKKSESMSAGEGVKREVDTGRLGIAKNSSVNLKSMYFEGENSCRRSNPHLPHSVAYSQITRQSKDKIQVLSSRAVPAGIINQYALGMRPPLPMNDRMLDYGLAKPTSNIMMKNLSLNRASQLDKERETRETKVHLRKQIIESSANHADAEPEGKAGDWSREENERNTILINHYFILLTRVYMRPYLCKHLTYRAQSVV